MIEREKKEKKKVEDEPDKKKQALASILKMAFG